MPAVPVCLPAATAPNAANAMPYGHVPAAAQVRSLSASCGLGACGIDYYDKGAVALIHS